METLFSLNESTIKVIQEFFMRDEIPSYDCSFKSGSPWKADPILKFSVSKPKIIHFNKSFSCQISGLTEKGEEQLSLFRKP
jgi:hypothetical protein